MQEKNIEIIDKFGNKLVVEHKEKEVFQDVDNNPTHTINWGFEIVEVHRYRLEINPYQETSDDCTGNLFKKKI